MTLDTSLSRAHFEGNGAATEFPFTFRVWDSSEIAVSVGLPDGTSETVTPDAVTLTETGGTVTYTRNGAPLPAGYTLGIVRSMPFVQPDDYISGTRFDAEVIERALDIACAERQQLRESLSRAVIVDASSDAKPLDMANEILKARTDAAASADAALTSREASQASALEAASSAEEASASASSAAASATESAGILEENQEVEAHIQDMIQNMANASVSRKVFLYGANEREAAVPAGTAFTVPSYQVGTGSLVVFIDGTRAIEGRDYEETGEALSVSTELTLTFDLQIFHELSGEVLSAVTDPEDPSAVQRISALEARLDATVPLPPGIIVPHAGKTEPLGWKWLNGQKISGVSSVFPDFKKWAVDDGNAVLCTLEDYETELENHDGQCGRFGWDEETDTLRLPCLSAFVGGALTSGDIGDAVQAGLPNITGGIILTKYFINSGTGAFAVTGTTNSYPSSGPSGDGYNQIHFDASLASSVYGRSDTVTPAHVKYAWIIKVADAVCPPSLMDARRMSALVSGLRDEVETWKAEMETWKAGVPELAADAAAPGNGAIDVSLSDNLWTATDSGWFNLSAVPSGNRAYVQIQVYPEDASDTSGTNYVFRTDFSGVTASDYAFGMVPVRKGQKVRVVPSNVSSWHFIRFIPAGGSAQASGE